MAKGELKYRKKTEYATAERFAGTEDSASCIQLWLGGYGKHLTIHVYAEPSVRYPDAMCYLLVPTADGVKKAEAGDYVVRSLSNGELSVYDRYRFAANFGLEESSEADHARTRDSDTE